MNFAIDLMIVLIVLFCAVFGMRKGFIRSCCNFLCGLASFIFTAVFSRPLGAYFSKTFFKPFFSSYLSNALSKYFSEQSHSTDSDVFAVVSNFFQEAGLDQSVLQGCYQASKDNTQDFIQSAIDAVALPLADSIGYAVALVLLFVVIFLLCKFVLKFFDLVAKLPVLNFANHTLGLVFGILFGLLHAFLFSAALALFEPLIQNANLPFLSDFSLDKTYLADFLAGILKL